MELGAQELIVQFPSNCKMLFIIFYVQGGTIKLNRNCVLCSRMPLMLLYIFKALKVQCDHF